MIARVTCEQDKTTVRGYLLWYEFFPLQKLTSSSVKGIQGFLKAKLGLKWNVFEVKNGWDHQLESDILLWKLFVWR